MSNKQIGRYDDASSCGLLTLAVRISFCNFLLSGNIRSSDHFCNAFGKTSGLSMMPFFSALLGILSGPAVFLSTIFVHAVNNSSVVVRGMISFSSMLDRMLRE